MSPRKICATRALRYGLLLLAMTLLGQSTAAAATLLPTRLRCEYLANPEGIDVRQARLSWELEATDPAARGQHQSAFRILAASTLEGLASDNGDLWDSGKISGDPTFQHRYEGEALAAGQRVFWKVRVWDGDDQASDWSDVAQWSIGLLDASDWGAQWIGAAPASPSDLEGKNPAIPPSPYLRRVFSIDGTVARAALYVTALGEYECRLNGQRVGDHQLAPEWTDYHQRVSYQSYDVTAKVQQGENVLGAQLGDGWYLGRLGPTRWDKKYPRRGVYGKDRRLLLRLDILKADGSTQTLVSDGEWKIEEDGPIRMADHFLGETYDARKEQAGWDAPGFDDSDWKPVTAEPLGTVNLEAQSNEPIRVVKELTPIAVTEPKPGVYIFDLGQNIAGWCRIRLNGKAGQEVVLRHGEMLNPDGTLYTENLAAAVQTDRFILAGGGEKTFEPHFTYHGFRYVEVTGLDAAPEPSMLTGRVLASDTPATGDFECSNPMLNQLFRNAVWTQRGNMHSVPTDCPQRDERCGWMGDAQVFAQSAIFNMDMAAFFTKWLQDIRDAQADDGSFPDIAPHPYGPNERFKNAPGWADAGVVVPWRLYQNYGDLEVLRGQIDAAKRFIDGIRRDNPDLLWRNNTGNHYGDWLNGDTIKAKDYPKKGGALDHDIFATAFFAYSTSLVARMCDLLGQEQHAARYHELAEAIRTAFNRSFVQEDGHIQGDTQAGYALALHFDLLPEALRPKAAQYMVEAIHRYDDRISTGFHSTYRMLFELTRWGYNDLAYKLVESTRFPSWGYSIEQGATTIWERWDGYVKGRGFQNPGMNSFNHYAIGAVVEWLYRNVAGINPDDEHPGYRHFVIRPRPGGTLTWARANYHAISGAIRSDWQRSPEEFRLDLHVPPNTTATVYVPASDANAVHEGKSPAAEAPGVSFLNAHDGTAVYQVAAGRYRFRAPAGNTGS